MIMYLNFMIFYSPFFPALDGGANISNLPSTSSSNYTAFTLLMSGNSSQKKRGSCP